MKLQTLIRSACALLLVLFVFGSISAQQLDWLDGPWEGVGYQENTNTVWSIALGIDSGQEKYEIEYPSLSCGGVWELESSDENKAVFVERIKTGLLNCVNNGRIVVTKIDQEYVTFSYFHPYDNSLNAWSTLKRPPKM